ncbi:glutaredoxin-like protein NrdH [Rhodococcus ruber]|uniref:Glutaredoxin-like protein NrdH n=1 Tax=Rhodococcus ruber TaxID=1830 RepID=A0A098BMT0_9NOCA|nr:glutaredoxin-like protein NrdH [Rhodococcus ruber]MCZ4533452.1 glutaredoxin-like protein NrdH [Rhodococcus ruber]CDZ89026.1 Glutaredoxin-like protein NrdH [Rhodococcus ruber]
MPDQPVTIYTKPSCVQCDASKRRFKNLKIAYTEIDITQDDAARDYVLGLGYSQAPVIVAGGDHWAGYKPDRIDSLA